MPIVATLTPRSDSSRQVALVGVATQGGRFPPAWRALLTDVHPQPASRSRTGSTRCSRTIPSSSRWLDEHGVELRDLRRPPRRPRLPDGRQPRGGRTDRPHGRLGLRDREDDRLARARPSSAGEAHRVGLRSDRADGDRDRRLGNLGRRGRRGLHRRAPPSVSSSRDVGAGASCCSSRVRAPWSIRRTPGSRSACSTGRRRTLSCSATEPAQRRSRGIPAIRCRRCPSSSSSTSGHRCPVDKRASSRWRSTRRDSGTTDAAAAVAAAAKETGLPAARSGARRAGGAPRRRAWRRRRDRVASAPLRWGAFRSSHERGLRQMGSRGWGDGCVRSRPV